MPILVPVQGRRIVIVGGGRVGGSLAAGLHEAGASVALLGRQAGADSLREGEIVILAVPDSVLPSLATTIAGLAPATATLMHTCGSRGPEVFDAHDGPAGCIHPAIPVATAHTDLSGVWWGVTAVRGAEETCRELVEAIGGRVMLIEQSDRVAYHAALVHASNHLVALAADAASSLPVGAEALIPLLARTVENVAALGPEGALTGPVSRGDAATLVAHLAAIPEDVRESYRQNALRALALAESSGRLDAAGVRAVRAALDGGEA